MMPCMINHHIVQEEKGGVVWCTVYAAELNGRRQNSWQNTFLFATLSQKTPIGFK